MRVFGPISERHVLCNKLDIADEGERNSGWKHRRVSSWRLGSADLRRSSDDNNPVGGGRRSVPLDAWLEGAGRLGAFLMLEME